MSRSLLLFVGAAVFCDSPRTFAAAQNDIIWQLGDDDHRTTGFRSENGRSNEPPGEADSRDDDHYLAGTYADPIGILAEDEELRNFERAVSERDPVNRIHFPLTPEQISSESALTLTVDLMRGGAWTGVGQPGFGVHDIEIRFNGELLLERDLITDDATLVMRFPADEVSASSQDNIVEIRRTGGSEGGYIQIDYVRLEADADAFRDADGDRMPLWFEEVYGLSDADASDAASDLDGDLSSALEEFQRGTNPTDPDSDNDGLTDAEETLSDPTRGDTDGDGLSDAEEGASSPTRIDSDNDGFPDKFEVERGSDPTASSSTPFPFSGVIGLQFVCERSESQALKPHEAAGLFRFPNWNSTTPLPHWYVDESPLTGSMENLVDTAGDDTGVSVSWSYRHSVAGHFQGPSDERLFNGMISAEDYDGGNVPVSVTISDIPYVSYDLIVYLGDENPNADGTLELAGSPLSRRFFTTDSSPPFQGWDEITATDQSEIEGGNYVRYRGLSGSTNTLLLQQLSDRRVSMHGFQIIDRSTDTDRDGFPDSIELEYGLDPAFNDAAADLDEDGLTNADEFAAGTDPANPDTDLDGLFDGLEATHNGNPLNPDTDGDSLADGDEVYAQPFPSLVNLRDSDADLHPDDVERSAGSDPMDPLSRPAPVPIYNIYTNAWSWRMENVRIRWNHSQAMLGALEYNDAMLVELETEINDGGWRSLLSMGLNYREGRLRHRFRCNQEVFHREDRPTSGHYSGGSDDISAALGFSGYGENDISHPLRFEFTATRPNWLVNNWTLTFTISDVRDPSNPVVVASHEWQNSVAVAPGIPSGTAIWTDSDGNPNQITIDLHPGLELFFSDGPIGPVDSDTDGMMDEWEDLHSFNKLDASDAPLDADGDGLTNLQEFLAGTDPRKTDTDGDGATDAQEFALGTSASSAASYPEWIDFAGNPDDLDGNGLSDAWNLWFGGKDRSPHDDDDGDGMTNLEESEAGTDPDDADSKLELKIFPSGRNLVVEWTDLPHKFHKVECSDLATGWQDIPNATQPLATRGKRKVTLINEFNGTSPSKFFRVNVDPLDQDNDGVEDWIEERILQSSTTEANSLGQPLTTSGNEIISGDARALMERLRDGSDSHSGTSQGSDTTRPSAVHASRFLMQASFGPVPEEIDEVRQMGIEAWIDRQLNLPPSYLKPYIKEIQADAANGNFDKTYAYNEEDDFIEGVNFTTPWARHAIGAEDQLRQRVAFALSQILVISRRDDRLESKAEAMTDYYDLMIEHAFGSYEDLLLKVSLHPAMGWYLSSVGNQKADPEIQRFPDENYAREIMQLFSIGLWELNPDGTRKLDQFGEPIQTYDTGDITELARVFTGLYYDSPYGWGSGGWAESHFLKPMVMHPEHHDFGRKSLLNGFIIPERDPTSENGMLDVHDAVSNLFNHPSTAPFISRRLIQFIVTANPSPSYVERISSVFENDGAGKRGNLGAVIRAILMDPEARLQPTDDGYGKVREPVIRTMHLGRLFNATKAHPDFVWWNSESTYYDSSFQEPLRAPSVFNFFTPEYQAPGDIRDRGLVSPGFQIIDTYSSISFPNLLWDYLRRGFVSSWNGPRYPLDYSESLLAAEDLDVLIDRLDLLICTGNMSTRTRTILRETLSDPELTPHDRLAVALWTTINSPEGATQR